MLFWTKLEAWYNDFGRTLPWRGIDDAYRIWVSEIILQQTRIEQGRDYYHRFVEAFPTVAALAAASEAQVLRQWQGLGYYSRARNMHAAAKYVMEELGGHFPDSYEGLLLLRGVGSYTAAAIASFAYRLPYPVIDGNVYRFISRLYGLSTPIGTPAAYREFEQLLLRLIDRQRPDRFNAALMDFGSLQCRPQPTCEECPFAAECVARREGRVALLPVKAPKAKPQERWLYYIDLRWRHDDETFGLMRRRSGQGIWRGLYEFTLLEYENPLGDAALRRELRKCLDERYGCGGAAYEVGDEWQHQLTHRTLHVRFVKVELAAKPLRQPEEMQVLSLAEMKKVPVPRLIDRYLQQL